MSRDALARCEMAAVAEEVLSGMRHDLRNKFGAVSNAVHYIRTRVKPTDVWSADARIGRFFEIIEKQMDAANAILDDRAPLRAIYEPGREPLPMLALGDCIMSAVRQSGAEVRDIDLGHTKTVQADRAEVTLLMRCLAEGRAAVEVKSADEGQGVTVIMSGPTSDNGDALRIAQRICRRYDWTLTSTPESVQVSMQRVASSE